MARAVTGAEKAREEKVTKGGSQVPFAKKSQGPSRAQQTGERTGQNRDSLNAMKGTPVSFGKMPGTVPGRPQKSAALYAPAHTKAKPSNGKTLGKVDRARKATPNTFGY